MHDDDDDEPIGWRDLEVPATASGMRLDRFLARRFADRSRTWLARGIKEGLVTDGTGRPLRASAVIRGGDALRLFLEGIAPSTPAPPFPPILHEDDLVVAVDKPAGLLAHPSGTNYAWALISLAKARWPERRVDLVHRLDRDTSGVQLLTKDLDAKRYLFDALNGDVGVKEYLALVKGQPEWDERVIERPIGSADGEIRIQMAARDDGLPARTDVTVLGRRDGPGPGLALVRCRIHTGRTHQIRVHLFDAGFPLLGDRLYGVPPEVFLSFQHEGVTDAGLAASGAARQALHCERMTLPHPDGGLLHVEAPLATDLQAIWDDPSILPWRP